MSRIKPEGKTTILSNTGEVNDALSGSFYIGNYAPKSVSDIKVVQLSVPDSIAINNIKLGLTQFEGNSNYLNNIKYEILDAPNYGIIPNKTISGVNSEKDPNNEYNILVDNFDPKRSKYVHLQISFPEDLSFTTYNIKFSWFFDFAGGTNLI